MKKSNKKGFTLAELLIVVAIIAVLVAIAIPVFSAQLEKSREAVDAANIRAAYAEVMADYISGKEDTEKTVTLKQQTTGWANKFDLPTNLTGNDVEPTAGATVTVKMNTTGDGVVVDVKLPQRS